MAIILDGPVTPDEGTLFVRNIPGLTDAAALDAFVPDVYGPSTEFDFTVISRQGNTARFRAFDAPAHVNPRDQMTINRVPLVPLSDSRPVIGENELVKLYGLSYFNDPKAAAAAEIYNDLENIALDIRRRAVQFKGSLLATGTAVLNEGGLNGVVDYGVPAGNKLTAPTLWTTNTADIITFLNQARAAYIARNGYAPAKLLTSTNVLTLMQQNTKLQGIYATNLGGTLSAGYAGLMPQAAVAAVLGTFNLPDPTQYICDAQVLVDGVFTPALPSNVIVLGPPDGVEMARYQWGPTVTGQQLAAEGALTIGDVPGLVGFVDRGDEFPYKQRAIGDSLGFGGVTNPNAHMILTVA